MAPLVYSLPWPLKQKLILVNMRGLSKIGSGGILMTVSYFQECAMFVCIVMDYYKLGESICIQN